MHNSLIVKEKDLFYDKRWDSKVHIQKINRYKSQSEFYYI